MAYSPAIKYITEGGIRIRGRNSTLVPMEPTPNQQTLLDGWDDDIQKSRPIREIILKARQIGASTIASLYLFANSILHEGVNSLMASLDENSRNILWEQKYRTYAKYAQPEAIELSANSAKRMTIKDTASTIWGFIGTDDLSRGGTVQNAHLTEFPFWADPDMSWETLRACLPDIEGTSIFLESTASNPDDRFERMFRNAWDEQRRGLRGEYRASFFPWFDEKTYARNITKVEGDYIMRTLLADEKELVKLGVKPKQLAWRRNKIEKDYDGVTAKFPREYPATIDEAFTSKRESCFDLQALSDYRRRVSKPKHVYNMYINRERKAVFRDSVEGPLHVFRVPAAGHKYVVGADPAGIGNNDAHADKNCNSAAVVLDAMTGEIVATYRNRVDLVDFAGILYSLGMHYNNAIMAPENNASGVLTVEKLGPRGLNYPNMFYSVHGRFNNINNNMGLGWHTDLRSKPLAVQKFMSVVRDQRIALPCKRLLEEMETFREIGDGRYAASSSHYSDMVMAAAIAVYVGTRSNEDFAWSPRDKGLEESDIIVLPRKPRINPFGDLREFGGDNKKKTAFQRLMSGV